MDLAIEQFGCVHYRRKCKIRAPCCGEIFDCRHCHNEVKDSLEVSISDRHEIPRHEIKLVICSLCNKEQDVQQDCSNCGACLGKHFCAKCNFYDDDLSKNQFHCDGCGICRTGGAENFFHCDKCGCCYSYALKDSHRCVERAMHHNCPVCFEYLFDSTKDISALRCGHTIHLECLYELRSHQQFSCPVCLRSACDMSHAWQKLDQENTIQITLHSGCSIADASNISKEDDMDPLQRLREDIKRAIPHLGTQVPGMQLVQHPADKRRPGSMLQSLKNSESTTMLCAV